MEDSAPFIYLLVYKLALIVVALLSLYLGYRLFTKGIFTDAGTAQWEAGKFKVLIKKAAPGTFFCIVGMTVLCVLIFQGAGYKSETKDTTTDNKTNKSSSETSTSVEDNPSDPSYYSNGNPDYTHSSTSDESGSKAKTNTKPDGSSSHTVEKKWEVISHTTTLPQGSTDTAKVIIAVPDSSPSTSKTEHVKSTYLYDQQKPRKLPPSALQVHH